MSLIPSIPVAAVLQSPLAQRTAAAGVDAEAQRSAAATRDAGILDDQQTLEIENTDSDTRVHSDASGQGGGGTYHFDQSDEDESAGQKTKPEPPAEGTQLDLFG